MGAGKTLRDGEAQGAAYGIRRRQQVADAKRCRCSPPPEVRLETAQTTQNRGPEGKLAAKPASRRQRRKARADRAKERRKPTRAQRRRSERAKRLPEHQHTQRDADAASQSDHITFQSEDTHCGRWRAPPRLGGSVGVCSCFQRSLRRTFSSQVTPGLSWA